MTTEIAPVTVAVVEPSSFFDGGVGGGGVGAGVGVGGAATPSLLLLPLMFSGSAKVEMTTRRGAGLRWWLCGLRRGRGGGGGVRAEEGEGEREREEVAPRPTFFVLLFFLSIAFNCRTLLTERRCG